MLILKPKLILWTMGVAIFALLVFKCSRLQQIRFEMDGLETQLNPIKAVLKPSSKIGFVSHVPNDYDMYYELRYVLAPQTFIYENCDTVIAYQEKGKPSLLKDNYKVVAKSDRGQISILLLVRNK